MSIRTTQTLSADDLAAYRRDGYLLVRSLFTSAEIDKLLQFAQRDPTFQQALFGRTDSDGTETKLALWNYATDDLYSMFARSPRIVEPMEQILEGEVYLYHMKMNVKEPQIGGAWEWHQDYGYWYNNGCLYPLLASCMISVTPSNKPNGCLQVLRGSHLMGRMNHGKVGEQTGADLERVEAALERLERVYVESEPGDALFFDCNLLHRSDANRSSEPRWSLICCYNARRNDPYKDGEHPGYSPLAKASDDAILTWQPPAAAEA